MMFFSKWKKTVNKALLITDMKRMANRKFREKISMTSGINTRSSKY